MTYYQYHICQISASELSQNNNQLAAFLKIEDSGNFLFFQFDPTMTTKKKKGRLTHNAV